MRLPVVQGVIHRRILANYRVDPAVLQRMLPAPFRPKLIDGVGIAGICMIRLKHLRPRGLPAFVGVGSENAAHRIAVEWEQDGQTREGVYITRRDTASRFNHLVGGRIFPGLHHHARFDVRETGDELAVRITSDDQFVQCALEATVAAELPEGSIFGSLDRASTFFERGAVGFSPGRGGTVEGLELRSHGWKVEPLNVRNIASSIFDGSDMVPKGSAQFDCALLMRGIPHEWHERASPCGGCASC